MPASPAHTERPDGGGVGRFAVLGGFLSGITILATIVRSKVTAQTVGPAGLGTFAETQQLFTLAMTITTVATGPALISRLARDVRDGHVKNAGRAVGASLVFGVSLSLVALIVVTIAYPYLLSTPLQRPIAQLACLGVAALLLPVGQAYGALFTAQGRARQLAIQGALVALVGTAIHVLSVLTWGFAGQFYSVLAGGFCATIVSIWLGRATGVPVRLVWDSDFSRNAFRIGATSLLAAVAGQATYTAIRVTLDRIGGHLQGALFNGQYQAALTIGSQYFSVVTGGLGTYFFPRYAGARTTAELEKDVWAAAEFALRVAPPIVFAMLAVRGPIIHLLYSARFDGAVNILGYQLAGDIAKAVSWAYAGPLLYRGDVRGYLLSETIGAALLVGFSFCCIRLFGLTGAGIAYAGAYLVYMVAAAWLTARFQGIRVRAAHLWIGAAGTTVAGLSEVLRLKYARVDVVLLTAALVWAWRSGLFSAARAALIRLRARFVAGSR